MHFIFKIKTLTSLCLGMMLAACGSADDDYSNQQQISNAVELSILHINDHHSHLDEEEWTFEFENAGSVEQYTVLRGGFARVTGLINELAAGKMNVLKMHSGDAITGDLYFNLTNGKADADAMQTACFDSFVLGNHEFDNKDAGLRTFLDFFQNSTCENPMSILSSNVRFGANSVLSNDNRIQPYQLFERGGETFAVIGLTVANKTKNSSQPDADTVFEDELITAQDQINQLKQQGISRIILQTHVGYELDQKLASNLTDVDVIIGGDSHTLLGSQSLKQVGLSPSGAYPTQVKNKEGDLVCIAQAWQYGYVVGELNVKFDPTGRVESCAGIPHLLIGHDIKKVGMLLDDPEKMSLLSKLEQANIPFKPMMPDQGALSILKSYQADKQAFASFKVATAEVDLCLRRVPGQLIDSNRSSIANCNRDPSVNMHGGDIQQLVAEAFYQQGKTFFNADFSIQNGGGVRIDIPQGTEVNVATIYTVLPFKNTLVGLEITGAEIKSTLEDAISSVIDQKNSGSYPYSGGLRWHVDTTRSKGHRVSSIEVRQADGRYQALNLERTYRAITIEFLANGQDGFTTLQSITGDRRTEVGLDYAEAFLKYVDGLDKKDGLGQIVKLPIADYSTQSYKE